MTHGMVFSVWYSPNCCLAYQSTKADAIFRYSVICRYFIRRAAAKKNSNKQAYGLNHRAFAIYGSGVVGRQCPNIGRDHNE